MKRKPWEELAAEAQGGDAAALAELLRRLSKVFAGWARSFRGHDPDDLAQLAVIKVWQQLGRYQVGRNFGSWVKVVGTRAMVSAARRKVLPTLDIGAADGVADRPPPDEWAADCLAACSAEDRAIVCQKLGLVGRPATLKQLAHATGRGVNHVRQSIERGLAAVRGRYETVHASRT